MIDSYKTDAGFPTKESDCLTVQKEPALNLLKYRESLFKIQQFQIQYITNMLNLVLNSKYYDPTTISAQRITDKTDFENIPSAENIANSLVHHNIGQEEKILQQLLLSDDSFTNLAMRHISKLSNLVAPPLANDPIRSEKNRFIVSATIVSRAAIKFGMPSDLAFSYSDYFIIIIEDCTSLKEIWDLQMKLFSFYRNKVSDIRNKSHYSYTTITLLSYIETNIGTNYSFQDICAELELDYKYASNCFKKDTGFGFNKYLTKEKMEIAKKELLTTEDSIQTIAESLGYNNAYYFTRTFRSCNGISPTEFRKSASELY